MSAAFMVMPRSAAAAAAGGAEVGATGAAGTGFRSSRGVTSPRRGVTRSMGLSATASGFGTDDAMGGSITRFDGTVTSPGLAPKAGAVASGAWNMLLCMGTGAAGPCEYAAACCCSATVCCWSIAVCCWSIRVSASMAASGVGVISGTTLGLLVLRGPL